ncbi:thioredoxin family protein [soil metagenome]
MSLTPSTMLPLGTSLPPFELKATTNEKVSSRAFDGSPLLVIFMCNHCPFVKHLQHGLVKFANDYMPKGLAVVAISSNCAETYPDDSFEMMIAEVRAVGYPFPYLFDESQEVAKNFRAACTPDFFLFDQDDMLVYRGQFDDSRPGSNVAVTGDSLRVAVDALLSGHKPDAFDQKPSMGCNIKWKDGNEPDYVHRGAAKAAV